MREPCSKHVDLLLDLAQNLGGLHQRPLLQDFDGHLLAGLAVGPELPPYLHSMPHRGEGRIAALFFLNITI